jgi:hypothetical protein
MPKQSTSFASTSATVGDSVASGNAFAAPVRSRRSQSDPRSAASSRAPRASAFVRAPVASTAERAPVPGAADVEVAPGAFAVDDQFAAAAEQALAAEPAPRGADVDEGAPDANADEGAPGAVDAEPAPEVGVGRVGRRRRRSESRQCYTIEFKLACVELMENGTDQDDILHQKFRIDPERSIMEAESKKKLLRDWRGQKDILRQAKNARVKRRRTHVGKIVLPPEVEVELVLWVRSLRNDGIPVSQRMLQFQALVQARDVGIPTFKASRMWVKGFLKRHRLSLRTRTRQGQIAPDDANEVAENFARRVRTICAREGNTEIINADQTCVFLSSFRKRRYRILVQKLYG